MSAVLTPPMPAASPAPVAPVPQAQPPLYRLSVEQYEAMIGAGIFLPEDRVELVHGMLVRKMTQNPPHTTACLLVKCALEEVVPGGWHLRGPSPIALPGSRPEPDEVLARGRSRDYAARHPTPNDLGLVVEVSDSTLAYDQTTKKATYAAAGIPTYWIVNLVEGILEVYTEPFGAGDAADYRVVSRLEPKDGVVLTLDGVALPAVRVAGLLP